MQRTIPPPPKTQGSSLLEDPFLGMEIGALRIVELIGEGGFGAVYKAFDSHTQTHQAIKILRVNRNAHLKQAIHERFQREAHILQQIDHPYIVRSGEFGQIADGVFYLVMEYLQGESFHERRLRLQQIPPSDLLRWLPQLGSALHYIHQREIIHRDLKPENLFLHRASPQSEEVLKLLDFGIASIAAESSITQTGKAFGSPLYMSPEQVKGEGKRATAQTDIYSLGIILYEALTGVPPFQGEGPAIMFAHIMTPPPRLSLLCPNIPWNEPLERALQRALAKEPEERWPNIHAMLQPILAGLQELSQSLSQKTSGDLSRITAPQRGLSAFGQAPPISPQELIYQDEDDHHQTAAMTPPGLAHLSITSDPFAQDEATIAKPSARIVSFEQLPAAKHLTSTQEEIEVAFIEQDEILDLDTAHLDFDLPSARAPITPLPRNQTAFPSPASPHIPPPPPSLHTPNRPPLSSAFTSPQIPPPPPTSKSPQSPSSPPQSARPLTPPPPPASRSPQSPLSPPQSARPLTPPPSFAHPSAPSAHPSADTSASPLPLLSDASSVSARGAASGNISSGGLSPIAPSRSTALPWLLLVMGVLLLLFGMIRLFFSDDVYRAEQVLPEHPSPQNKPPLSHRVSPPLQHPPLQQTINPQRPNIGQRPHSTQRPISPVDPKGSSKKNTSKVGKKKIFRKRKKKTRPKQQKKDPRNLFEFEPELSP